LSVSMSAAERRAANNKLIKENNDQLAALKADIEAKRPMDTLRTTMVNLPNKPPPKKNEDKLKLVQKKLLQGHFGKIYAMDWGKDDTMLISAAQDGSIIVWNALNGHKLDLIELKSTWVMSCAFSKSGRMTASGGLDNTVTIYKISETGQAQPTAPPSHPRELVEHGGYISGAVFIDDTKVISSSGDQKCILWDTERGTALHTFSEHKQDVMDIDMLNDNLCVTGSVDHNCKVWDYRLDSKTKTMTFHGHEGDINSVCAMHNKYSFISGGDDSRVMLFDTRSYSPLQEYKDAKISHGIASVALSSSGRYAFAGYDDSIARTWDTLTGELVQNIGNQGQPTHSNRVTCLGVNSNGTAVATGSWDMTLRVWA